MGSSHAPTQYRKGTNKNVRGMQVQASQRTVPALVFVFTTYAFDCAGKGGGRGGKASIAGVKRGADTLFQKQWENTTEPSEAALSDGSAFPATTEASARCKFVTPCVVF